MTIKEIKDLTKFLTDKELEKIKDVIKSKVSIFKTLDVEEEEMGQVLNTLFAILVIEKTLENEKEGIEDIRAELEQELLEAYEIYDNHMARYKKEEKKKKKKNWLLDFLFMSEEMKNRKDAVGASKKEVAALQKELSKLRQMKSDENLKNIMHDRHGHDFDEFCKCWKECDNPFHNHDHDHDHDRDRDYDRGGDLLSELRDDFRDFRQAENILTGEIDVNRFSMMERERNSAFLDNHKLEGAISSIEKNEIYNKIKNNADAHRDISKLSTSSRDVGRTENPEVREVRKQEKADLIQSKRAK